MISASERVKTFHALDRAAKKKSFTQSDISEDKLHWNNKLSACKDVIPLTFNEPLLG
jgi:hypothetical protein